MTFSVIANLRLRQPQPLPPGSGILKGIARSAPSDTRRFAFTLLELMTSIVIIIILAALLTPAFARLRERARATQCSANLKNLYVATNGYIQDNRAWPQIKGLDVSSETFADAWQKALQPYNIGKNNWSCPTIKAETGYSADMPFHLDYIPTPFGPNWLDPFKWPTHPWFSERGSVHGQGNLIILANGSVQPLNEISSNSQSAPD